MPHTYRHVLGWYRIVREFEEAGVNAICVFDGSERSEAKRAEVRGNLLCPRGEAELLCESVDTGR